MDGPATLSGALPSPLHRALLLTCFVSAALFLLQPLYLPRRADAESGGAGQPSSFAETATINQVARIAVGSKELTSRYPGSARLMGSVEDSLRQGEEDVKSREGLVLRLAVYEEMGMDEARGEMERRLSEAAAERGSGEAARAQAGTGGSGGSSDALDAMEALYLEGRPLSGAEAEAIERKFGFAGRLAGLEQLRRSGGDTQELEASLRESAVRYLAGFVLMMGSGFVLLGVGALLLIAALVQWRSGAVRTRFAAPLLPDWLHLETFTAFMLLMILAGTLGERLPRPEALPLLPAVVLQGLLLCIVAYPLLYRAEWAEVRADLGLSGGAGAWREARIGPVGYVAALPLVVLGALLAVMLVRWTGQDLSEGMHPIVPMIKGEQASAVNAAMALLVAVAMAPVLEEITFRGFFYGALRSRFPAWVSVLVSAALFAGIHPQGLIGFPMLMAIGTMLAVLREWRGSLIAPIVAHGCTNGVTLAIVLVGF